MGNLYGDTLQRGLLAVRLVSKHTDPSVLSFGTLSARPEWRVILV